MTLKEVKISWQTKKVDERLVPFLDQWWPKPDYPEYTGQLKATSLVSALHDKKITQQDYDDILAAYYDLLKDLIFGPGSSLAYNKTEAQKKKQFKEEKAYIEDTLAMWKKALEGSDEIRRAARSEYKKTRESKTAWHPDMTDEEYDEKLEAHDKAVKAAKKRKAKPKKRQKQSVLLQDGEDESQD